MSGQIKYNKDELVPPSFLDHTYFENILKSSENDTNLKLLEYKIVPGSKPGDHYASIMFKISVTYKIGEKVIENRSLIMKTIPQDDGTKRDILTQMPMFSNEIQIYTKILPEMERILQSCGDDEQMGPKLVYQTSDPPLIILEDITKNGFEMVYEPLNFDNLQIIIDKIAKYHALSFLITDENQDDVQFINTFGTPAAKEIFMKIMDGVSYLISQIKTWPGFELVYEKMVGAEEKLLDKVFNLYQPNKSSGYSILNHGDFHLKNMMFKKSGTKLDDVMLLDFQLPFWGSPGIDLAYLIFVVGNEEVHQRKNEVYYIYHSKFCSFLEKFGYKKKRPSLLDLNIEILKCGVEELFLVLCYLPFFFVDFTKIDMTELFDITGDAALAQAMAIYDNPRLVSIYKKLLPEFLYRGHMD